MLDLASLASIKSFAEQFNMDFWKLDLLINNAGILAHQYGETKGGFESHFGTNHLRHFALTAHLFTLLKRTTGSRIVNVSSNGHKMSKFDLNDLGWKERKYNLWTAYGDSKLANLYFSYELDRKVKAANQKVMVIVAQPGLAVSNLAKDGYLRHFHALNKLFAQKTSLGAMPIQNQPLTAVTILDHPVSWNGEVTQGKHLPMRCPLMQVLPDSSGSYRRK